MVVAASIVSVAAVVLGLTIKEDGHNAWHTVHAWGVLAIVGAVLTFAPAMARTFNLATERAWQVSLVGSGLLVLFWILLILPDVGSNTSLLSTVGAAAGAVATWFAPAGASRGDHRPPPGQAW